MIEKRRENYDHAKQTIRSCLENRATLCVTCRRDASGTDTDTDTALIPHSHRTDITLKAYFCINIFECDICICCIFKYIFIQKKNETKARQFFRADSISTSQNTLEIYRFKKEIDIKFLCREKERIFTSIRYEYIVER